MAIVAMAPAVPGNIASSAEYNKVIANIVDLNARVLGVKEARSSGDETVTTTTTDVNGTTINFTTYQNNTFVRFSATYNIATTGSSDIFIGSLMLDGFDITTGEANFAGSGSERTTVGQEWIINVTTAGSHTAKLRRHKTSNVDLMTLFSIHTKLIVQGNGVT